MFLSPSARPRSPLASITRLKRKYPLDRVVRVGGSVLLKRRAGRTPTAGTDKLLVSSEVTQHRDECYTRSCLHRADQGRLLDCVVRWGNLTEGKIRAYLGEVLEAVRYLHNCRIAHLDLKVSGARGATASMSDRGPATWPAGAASQRIHCSQVRRPAGTRDKQEEAGHGNPNLSSPFLRFCSQ